MTGVLEIVTKMSPCFTTPRSLKKLYLFFPIFKTKFSIMTLFKLAGVLITSIYCIFQTEKVDLENTVVDESQRQWKEQGASPRLRQDKCSGMIC